MSTRPKRQSPSEAAVEASEFARRPDVRQAVARYARRRAKGLRDGDFARAGRMLSRFYTELGTLNGMDCVAQLAANRNESLNQAELDEYREVGRRVDRLQAERATTVPILEELARAGRMPARPGLKPLVGRRALTHALAQAWYELTQHPATFTQGASQPSGRFIRAALLAVEPLDKRIRPSASDFAADLRALRDAD